MQRKKRLYVGCGLTSAPEEFIRGVIQLRDDLRPHFDVLDFWTPAVLGGKRDPTKIYMFDIGKVLESDVLLGICDFASFGLGYEVATALQSSKEVLLVAKRTSSISAFIQGINNPHCHFKYYDVWADVIRLALRHLR